MDTQELLSERQKTHGDYSNQANIIWATMSIWELSPNWGGLSPDKKETLHMIMHKIGRILVGNPEIKDHWDDIAGYATLSSQRCNHD